MTIICAIHAKGQTWIGSDTVIVRDDGFRSSCGPKWNIGADGWAIGLTGEHRAADVIAAHLRKLTRDLDGPFDFTTRIREVFDANRITPCPNVTPLDHTACYGQAMLLVRKGEIWEIGRDLSTVRKPNDVLFALGAGAPWAIGSGFGRDGEKSETTINRAIDAATTYNAFCGGKWVLRLG